MREPRGHKKRSLTKSLINGDSWANFKKMVGGGKIVRKSGEKVHPYAIGDVRGAKRGAELDEESRGAATKAADNMANHQYHHPDYKPADDTDASDNGLPGGEREKRVPARRGWSSGFFVSRGAERAQEAEACNQISICW